MNCATTNHFFVNEKQLFRNGITKGANWKVRATFIKLTLQKHFLTDNLCPTRIIYYQRLLVYTSKFPEKVPIYRDIDSL